MALERAQKAIDAFPESMSKAMDIGYRYGRIDERNGVKEPFYG